MLVSAIVAYGKSNRVIGSRNAIPWRLPNDMKWFREKTIDSAVIMGRKTFESMPGPLPKRVNVVLSRNAEYSHKLKERNCFWQDSLENALRLLYRSGWSNKEVFIIGGEKVYNLALPYCDRLYITEIEEDFEGDTFFPQIESKEWNLSSTTVIMPDHKNEYKHSFLVLERINNFVPLSF